MSALIFMKELLVLQWILTADLSQIFCKGFLKRQDGQIKRIAAFQFELNHFVFFLIKTNESFNKA